MPHRSFCPLGLHSTFAPFRMTIYRAEQLMTCACPPASTSWCCRSLRLLLVWGCCCPEMCGVFEFCSRDNAILCSFTFLNEVHVPRGRTVRCARAV